MIDYFSEEEIKKYKAKKEEVEKEFYKQLQKGKMSKTIVRKLRELEAIINYADVSKTKKELIEERDYLKEILKINRIKYKGYK